MKKRIPILIEESDLEKLDEQCTRLNASRIWIMNLLLKLWIKGGCKTLKDD